MKHPFSLLALVVALGTALTGCNTVPEIPDKTPCTAFIKAVHGKQKPCLAVPINDGEETKELEA